ncbi:thiolase-like protein [Dichotomopilus funicola]|uniref:3-oxoacyl-[acyl-carrier-protein] synthase, mitochondrial n=1 Tax=Dichotomopilus funicola TaxID=1934379 RepID=A0AAN6V8S2_9PEZI|nr:thiolase-like protein [Dichotomopilus funicola]
MRRVVVTGLGAITPLGVGIRRTWQRLLASESGLVSVAHRGRDAVEQAKWRELTSTVAGVVPVPVSSDASSDTPPEAASAGPEGRDGLWRPSEWLGASDQRRMSTFAQYAVAASEMALVDAGWRPTGEEEREMTGVCLGSGIGNLEDFYDTSVAFKKGGYKKVSPLFVPKILINLAAGHIAMRYGLRGPNHAATTACTTGAHSLGDASRFIAFGDANVMLAGGAESCIHPLTLAGFGRSRSLSTTFNHDPRASCRPFDAHRDGFVVAEGAAVVVLEEREHALRRGARVYAELRGYGCSGDAYHMTAPREDGAGALAAMRRALRNAGVKPREVDYVNAHATGTRVGDKAEVAAVRTLMMGEEGVDGGEGLVTVSSTKGAVGHLLGAAGAVEAVFAILAIAEGAIPPTLNLHNPDVGVGFNFVPREAQQKKVRVAVSNSFGFGGTNASAGFGRLPKRISQHGVDSLIPPRRAFSTTIPTTPSTTPRPTTIPNTPPSPTIPRNTRPLHTTPPLNASLGSLLQDRLRSALGGISSSNTNSYLVYGRTETLYKICAAPADYTIDEGARKAGTLQTTEEGEEIGTGVVPGGVWHDDLALLPTFSTWAHVTMLHLYLLVVRLRALDSPTHQAWQTPLVNHFFYAAELKMEDVHGLTSRMIRQTYLKDLFVQWRGVLLAYDEGLVKGDAVLAAAVWRNLFKAREDVDVRVLAGVVGWMREGVKTLGGMKDEEVLAGEGGAAMFGDLRRVLGGVDRPVSALGGVFKQGGLAK